jgi:hypothetical protein
MQTHSRKSKVTDGNNGENSGYIGHAVGMEMTFRPLAKIDGLTINLVDPGGLRLIEGTTPACNIQNNPPALAPALALHALLTLCSRSAHALLTLCSRSAVTLAIHSGSGRTRLSALERLASVRAPADQEARSNGTRFGCIHADRRRKRRRGVFG